MNTPIRFSGLTSGMDTASMVQQIMRAENMRMDRLTRRRQVLSWRQEDLRNTMTTLRDFRNNQLDHISPRGRINNPQAWNTMRATVENTSTTGNTNGITVTANSSANVGSFNATVIRAAAGDLVRGAQFNGSSPDANGVGYRGNVDLNGSVNLFLAGSPHNNLAATHGYMRINNIDVRVNRDDTIQQVIDRVNGNANIGARMAFDSIRGVFTLESTRMGEDAIVTTGNDAVGFLQHIGLENVRNQAYSTGVEATSTHTAITGATDLSTVLLGDIATGFTPGADFTMTIGGRSFIVSDTTSLSDFIDEINHANSNVRATFDYATSTLTLRAAQSGGQMSIGPDVHGVLAAFGIDADVRADITAANQGSGDVFHVDDNAGGRIVREAQDAIIRHHSPLGNVDIHSATNSFNVDGIRIDITAAAVGETFAITTAQNVDDAMDMVRDFIQAYNDLLRHINSLHSTARPTQRGNRNFFEPLTDEERQAMSDRDIERWEEQARTGLLHRDSAIRNFHATMRREMFEPVTLPDGRQIALHQIGITTVGMGGAREDRLIGVLEINEERLREMLESNPEDVQALFSQGHQDAFSNRPAERSAISPHVGVAWRLNVMINNEVIHHNGSFTQRVGMVDWNDGQNIMGRQIRDYDQRIERMQQFLIRRENHFFSMFARMEQAMAQSHAQMDSLFAMQGGM
ncbi:MAG: flagellar filament capping protein FliD [Defluviitaleaceae bacterium]|nr:flagellar filament capping protein FliD [Defluviitaleaceae bacterium]